ncbi:MAG: CHAP domain-containing protein [Deltaproteobacteria bacterium]|jgi:surface antigen|nr:CHAP domain-containing protein [Deltaproteobacteria bacterium]
MNYTKTSVSSVRNLWLVAATTLTLSACGSPELQTTEPVNPSFFQSESMPACHTALASFDGTTAYSNGDNTGTGVSCGGVVASGYRYQCVELVMRHFSNKWGIRFYGNAKDLLANAPRTTNDVWSNGDRAHPPVPGDMLVWTTGTWGHVALVTRVGGGTLDIIEQNVTGNGRATLPYNGASVGARWGSWVPAGWVHAKANTSGGGISWDCNNSAYMGRQLWTCSSGNLYRCEGGVPKITRCAAGCNVKPLGTDDTCK